MFTYIFQYIHCIFIVDTLTMIQGPYIYPHTRTHIDTDTDADTHLSYTHMNMTVIFVRTSGKTEQSQHRNLPPRPLGWSRLD